MSPPLTISLTGSTGHLGTSLIEFLLSGGYQVRALYRKTRPSLENKNLIWVQGSLSDNSSIQQLIKGSHTLIHAASLLSFEVKDRDLMYETNVVNVGSIIDQCIENKVRLAYISSSTAVQKKSDDQVYCEDLSYVEDRNFWYAWTKAKAEQLIFERMNHGLKAYVLRPTAIVGPPDHGPSQFGKTLYDLYKKRLPFITEGGYNIIDIRDLSATIINSLTLAKNGEIYLIGGHYANFTTLALLLGRTKAPPRLSLRFLRSCLPLIQGIHKIVPLKWPVNKESLYTLEHAPEEMNLTKSIRDLRHKSRPLEDTLADLVSWFASENTEKEP